jgi:hypothetical protein
MTNFRYKLISSGFKPYEDERYKKDQRLIELNEQKTEITSISDGDLPFYDMVRNYTTIRSQAINGPDFYKIKEMTTRDHDTVHVASQIFSSYLGEDVIHTYRKLSNNRTIKVSV